MKSKNKGNREHVNKPDDLRKAMFATMQEEKIHKQPKTTLWALVIFVLAMSHRRDALKTDCVWGGSSQLANPTIALNYNQCTDIL